MKRPVVIIQGERRTQAVGTTLADLLRSFPTCYLTTVEGGQEIDIRASSYVLGNQVYTLHIPPSASSVPILAQASPQVTRDNDRTLAKYSKGYISVLPNDIWSTIDAFQEFIIACSNAWQKTTDLYYAPYTAICQGSCAGKTFLALNSRKRFPLTYINLRKPDPLVSPQRTAVAADWIEGEMRNEGLAMRFLLAYFETVQEIIQANIQNGKFRAVLKDFHKLSSQRKFWFMVKGKIENKVKDPGAEDIISAANKAHSLLQSKVNNNRQIPVFLFVIDEARAMLDTCYESNTVFKIWRSTISQLKLAPIFFVLLDTTSRISNFLQFQLFDSSKRVQSGWLLFPPFYFFPFTGPWPTEKWEKSIDRSYIIPCAGHIAVQSHLFMPVKYSRPYFHGQVLRSAEVGGVLDDKMWTFGLVDFAKGKISPTTMKKESSSMAAVLSCKYALVPAQLIIAEQLVSSHCATLIEVTSDRAAIRVKYVPEPMLAEAATQILADDVAFESHLIALFNMLINRQLAPASTKGDLGEFVAAVYLMKVKDLASQRYFRKMNVRSYCLPHPTYTFLALLGDCNPAIEERTRSCLICFNAYQKIDSDITMDIMKDALKKNYAILPQSDQEAFDILIPTIFLNKVMGDDSVRQQEEEGKKEEQSFESLIEEVNNISAIVVQVKNWQHTISMNKAKELAAAQCAYLRDNLLFNDKSIVSIVIAAGTGITGLRGGVSITRRKKDVYCFISGFPQLRKIDFHIPQSVLDLLHQMMSIHGVPSSLQEHITELLSYNKLEKPVFTKKVENFSKYIYHTSSFLQPDRFGATNEFPTTLRVNRSLSPPPTNTRGASMQPLIQTVFEGTSSSSVTRSHPPDESANQFTSLDPMTRGKKKRNAADAALDETPHSHATSQRRKRTKLSKERDTN